MWYEWVVICMSNLWVFFYLCFVVRGMKMYRFEARGVVSGSLWSGGVSFVDCCIFSMFLSFAKIQLYTTSMFLKM